MKFYLALFVWLLMAAVLALGIVWAVNGTAWLLVVSMLAFIVAFAKVGCMSH